MKELDKQDKKKIMSNFATWMSQGFSMTVSDTETVEVFSNMDV